MKKSLLWFILFTGFTAGFSQEITTKVLNPPNQLRCNEAAPKLNQVLFGATPPNSEDKPVIVFVHGWFDNGYSWFMTKNDWYKRCYNEGYKTAFFFQSPNGTFQDNGAMVADMVRATCQHYNTNRVIAVCHSKGGYDMEWALYNSGVWDTVQGVITLSTPFWGAPMADVIANPGIRSALSIIPIVGPIFQGDGTYQMQPAYMAGVVRPMLDNHPDNHPEKFHCFASWGYDHVLHIPEQINLDVLMVVFPDSRPACGIIPGFNVLAGNLMSGFMNITGQLSRFVGVQDAYENPARDDDQYVDGLAPYFSSIRPGAFNFSEPPPSTMSKINHLDVLYAFEMWQYVKPQIEYCWQNPVLRNNHPQYIPQQLGPDHSTVSNFRFIQSKTASFTKYNDGDAKMIVIGYYPNSSIKIYEGNQLVKSIPLEYELNGMFDAFHEIALNELEAGRTYKIVCDQPVTALLDDGGKTSLKIKTPNAFYAGDAFSIKAIIENQSENLEDIVITGYLNRNLNEDGRAVSDLNIPIKFEYDATEKVFSCKQIPELPKGIYNVSVFANGSNTHRFATTSIALLQEKKIYTGTTLKIFPNPATTNISVSFVLPNDDELTAFIYDISGKLVRSTNMGILSAGNNEAQLKLDGLSKGTYLLQLNGRSFKAQQKLSIF